MKIVTRTIDEAFFQSGELGKLLFEHGGDMTMEGLADRTEHSVSYLQAVADGKCPVDLKLAAQIARALGIQVDEVMGDALSKKSLTEHELKMRIHDIVDGAKQPMNASQVYQHLIDRGVDVTFQRVRDLFVELVQQGMLIDANEPSYYAVG